MNEAQKKYFREYMREYRKTEKGKEAVKKANQRYWDKKEKEV